MYGRLEEADPLIESLTRAKDAILKRSGMFISLVMYGRLEEADPLIESLTRDKDAILKRSGMYTIAMAYCDTGNNSAIRKLLHTAVSHVNDDVRRAAVMGLGKLDHY